MHFVKKEGVTIDSNTDKTIDFREDTYKNIDENTLLNQVIRSLVIQFLKEGTGLPVYQRLFIFWPFPNTPDSNLEEIAKKAYNELSQAKEREVLFVRDS